MVCDGQRDTRGQQQRRIDRGATRKGVIVVNGSTMPAGDAVAPAAMLGHTALKSGHSNAFSSLPSAGTEWERIHQRAVKKAPKNITSEKMNQLMLQRNDRSTLCPYWPALALA
jgi:hypothetical protein